MTSYPQPQVIRVFAQLELLLSWALLLPTFALWFDIWNHINPVIVHATRWPNQFPFNCKNSTQNAPEVVFLSSKIEKFSGEGAQPPPPVGRGHPLPTPYPPRRSVPPALPVSPPDLGVLAETLGQPTPVGAKSPIFNRYSPVAPQP